MEEGPPALEAPEAGAFENFSKAAGYEETKDDGLLHRGRDYLSPLKLRREDA